MPPEVHPLILYLSQKGQVSLVFVDTWFHLKSLKVKEEKEDENNTSFL